MSEPAVESGLVIIADTRDRFSDFAPYVPSINDAGTVAFQAALRRGGTGVFTGDGESLDDAAVSDAAPPIVRGFNSHPDVDRDGSLCVYARMDGGGEALLQVEPGRVSVIADPRAGFAHIGPLGPTMNDARVIAFRGETGSQGEGVFLARDGAVECVADTTRFAAFYGLPVVDTKGAVVFRADLHDGRHGIFARRVDGRTDAVVESGERFSALGLFPCTNGEGAVVFSATLRDGGAGIFLAGGGDVRSVVVSGAEWESFRGALINDAGAVLFYGTRRGGQLGVYDASAPGGDAILAIGASLYGSSVTEFALNPVSVNNHGQLAIRVRLADHRQLIVRAGG